MLPSRDDDVATWLKAARDQENGDGTPWDRARWNVLDDLIEEYRLHADTGTPLLQHACDGGHCCNAEVCSKCGTAGCLEDARSGWYDDHPDPIVEHKLTDFGLCVRAGPHPLTVCTTAPDKRDECGCHPDCTMLPHACEKPCHWPDCLNEAEHRQLATELDADVVTPERRARFDAWLKPK